MESFLGYINIYLAYNLSYLWGCTSRSFTGGSFCSTLSGSDRILVPWPDTSASTLSGNFYCGYNIAKEVDWAVRPSVSEKFFQYFSFNLRFSYKSSKPMDSSRQDEQDGLSWFFNFIFFRVWNPKFEKHFFQYLVFYEIFFEFHQKFYVCWHFKISRDCIPKQCLSGSLSFNP